MFTRSAPTTSLYLQLAAAVRVMTLTLTARRVGDKHQMPPRPKGYSFRRLFFSRRMPRTNPACSCRLSFWRLVEDFKTDLHDKSARFIKDEVAYAIKNLAHAKRGAGLFTAKIRLDMNTGDSGVVREHLFPNLDNTVRGCSGPIFLPHFANFPKIDRFTRRCLPTWSTKKHQPHRRDVCFALVRVRSCFNEFHHYPF